MKKSLIILAFLPIFGYGQMIIRHNGAIVTFDNSVIIQKFNPKAIEIYNRFALPPDYARKKIISDVVTKLVDAGLWDKIDVRYFLNAHDVQASIVDWKSDTLKLEPVNQPFFTIDNGWYGDGLADYMKTGYNASLSGYNYALSDASISVFTGNKCDLNEVILGARESSNRNQFNLNQSNGDNNYLHNGVVTTVSSTSVTDTSGLYTSVLSGTNHILYLNKTLQRNRTGASPVGIPDLDNYLMAYNNEGLSSLSNVTTLIKYFEAGSAITSDEVSDLNDIIDYYNSNIRPLSTKYVDLITFDGQSNMYGIDVNDSLKYVVTSCEIWDSTSNQLTWIDAKTGIQSQPINVVKMNPLYSTSLNYEALPSKVFTAMYSVSGTQLYEDATIDDWNANSTGEYLDRYINFIDSTIKYMNNRNIEVRTIFRVKYQGETDADNLTKANAFEANETALINKYNTRFSGDSQNIHHIIIEITPNRTYSSIVNTAITNIGARSDVTVILNDDFVYSDGTHLDLDSHLLLGEKIFNLTYTNIE